MISKNSFDGFLQFKKKKNFNLATGRSSHLKFREKHEKNLEKIIKNKKNQKHRKCEICGKNRYNLLFIKNGFHHVRCDKCYFVYVNPILKEKIANQIIKKETSYSKVLVNKSNLRIDNKKFEYGLNKIKNKQNQKILDVGAGPGIFLDVAKKNGLVPYAVEFNEKCLPYLKKKKINILNYDFNKKIIRNKKYKDFFDIITIWTVLEHIPNINIFIKNLNFILKKKGKILIHVPNVESLSARILHEKCSTFAGHQHINHFSIETLKKFIQKNNFKIKDIETVISDAGTVNNYLDYQDPYLSNTKFRPNFTSPDFIHKNNLGYTILCIAEKK